MLDSYSVQVVRGTMGAVEAEAGRRAEGVERTRGTNANDITLGRVNCRQSHLNEIFVMLL